MEAAGIRGAVGHGSPAGRAVAAALGVCVGISGIDHGIFEMLQGNTPTHGLLIQAIGPDHLMWPNGTEDAFTIVPNFLVTGMLAILVGLTMIIWSVCYLDRPGASRVYIGLGLTLVLVGGGLGMLVFLLFGWLVARRIHRPPKLWTRAAPPALGATLDRIRPGLIALGFGLYAFALWVAITGYVPLVADPDACLALCWGALLAMLGLFALALFGAPQPSRPAARASA